MTAPAQRSPEGDVAAEAAMGKAEEGGQTGKPSAVGWIKPPKPVLARNGARVVMMGAAGEGGHIHGSGIVMKFLLVKDGELPEEGIVFFQRKRLEESGRHFADIGGHVEEGDGGARTEVVAYRDKVGMLVRMRNAHGPNLKLSDHLLDQGRREGCREVFRQRLEHAWSGSFRQEVPPGRRRSQRGGGKRAMRNSKQQLPPEGITLKRAVSNDHAVSHKVSNFLIQLSTLRMRGVGLLTG